MGLAPQRRLVQRRGMGGWTCLVAGGRRRGDGGARGVLGSESAATVHVSPVSRVRCQTEGDSTATWEAYLMTPPIPRAWFGLAFFFGIAAAAVITRTVEDWPSLVPVQIPCPWRRKESC